MPFKKKAYMGNRFTQYTMSLAGKDGKIADTGFIGQRLLP